MKFHSREDYSPFEENGFNNGNDIFERKTIGKSLSAIVKSAEDPLVIGLNAPWGEGKTTFLHMWKHDLEEAGVPVIYFDAFKHDHHQDPFLPLAHTIYKLAEETKLPLDKTLNGFVSSIGHIMKKTTNLGMKFTGRAIAHKVFGESDLAKLSSEILEETLDDLKIGTQVLNDYQVEKAAMELFSSSLGNLATDLLEQNNARDSAEIKKNIVFIIDELDRCRPDFSLALIERIKHVFSTKGIIFILSMNKLQLCASLKCIYGNNFDSNTYLDKFLNISTSLPRAAPESLVDTNMRNYVASFAEKFGMKFVQSEKEIFSYFATSQNISLRQLNKAITSYYLITSALSDFRDSSVRDISIGMCCLKYSDSVMYEEIATQSKAGYFVRNSFELSTSNTSIHFALGNHGAIWRALFSNTHDTNTAIEAIVKKWAHLNSRWSKSSKLISDIDFHLTHITVN